MQHHYFPFEKFSCIFPNKESTKPIINKYKQEDEVRTYGDMEDCEPLDTYADEEDDIDLVEQSIAQFLAVHCSAEEHNH